MYSFQQLADQLREPAQSTTIDSIDVNIQRQGLTVNPHPGPNSDSSIGHTVSDAAQIVEQADVQTDVQQHAFFISPECPVDAFIEASLCLNEAGAELVCLSEKTSPYNDDLESRCWRLAFNWPDAKTLDDQAKQTVVNTINNLGGCSTIKTRHALDCLTLPYPAPYKHVQLACFDMDSTLIKMEVIDELARYAGIGEKVSRITERAMRGELDFKQSFRARLGLLKGLDADVISEIKQSLPLMEGARPLMQGLAKRNITMMIFSGGFDVFAQQVVEVLGMDSYAANSLEIKNGALTGTAIDPIVDAQLKRSLLEQHTKSLGLLLENTLAVGDGANDLEMLRVAGMGVAFHAKPIVRAQAPISLSNNDLSAILHLL